MRVLTLQNMAFPPVRFDVQRLADQVSSFGFEESSTHLVPVPVERLQCAARFDLSVVPDVAIHVRESRVAIGWTLGQDGDYSRSVSAGCQKGSLHLPNRLDSGVAMA
jgi:hypothetical protein